MTVWGRGMSAEGGGAVACSVQVLVSNLLDIESERNQNVANDGNHYPNGRVRRILV